MLLFCDGFDSYAAQADLVKKWNFNNNNAWNFSATGGVNGGGAITCATNTGANFLERQITSSTGRLNVSFWMKVGATFTTTQGFLAFYKDGTFCTDFRFVGNFFSVANNSTTYTPVTPNLVDNAWHHMEISWRQTNVATAGNILIYVDGALVVNNTYNPINNANNTAPNRIILYGLTTGLSIDDFIMWDDAAGDNFVSSPLGVQYIETIRPNGAGSATNLAVTGSAANWSALSEAVHNGDTSYVSGLTGQDLYAYADMTTNPTTINGVVINSHVRVEGGGTATVANKLKSGATIVGSTPVALAGGNYKHLQSTRGLDPDTNSAWTKAAVDALEAGIEIT